MCSSHNPGKSDKRGRRQEGSQGRGRAQRHGKSTQQHMINTDKLIQVIGFTPHKNQLEIMNCKEREIYIAAGRRFGKSAISALLALRVLLQDNKKVWIVAPTYDLTGKVFEYLVKWFSKAVPSQRGNITYRPYPKIKTARGSILECRSTENPTGLLGDEVDLIIIDEAARIPRYIFDQYLYPVTSSRKGQIVAISTPFGKNWFYERWMKTKETNSSFQFSSLDGASIDMEEWERTKNILPEQLFKQEYMALFLEEAASVFRGVTSIVKEKCLSDAIPSHTYVMGVDLAKINDFSVLTVVDTYSHEVVAWERFKELDYNLQKARIKALAQRYNNARIIIDSTGVGNPISEDLRRESLMIEDFKFSNKSKQELIEKLAIFIEQKGIYIPNNVIIIDELSSYGYQMTESGNFKYSAPSGLHDDAVISLGLAVWGLDSATTNNPSYISKNKERKTKRFQYI
jgi:hypothetical protein